MDPMPAPATGAAAPAEADADTGVDPTEGPAHLGRTVRRLVPLAPATLGAVLTCLSLAHLAQVATRPDTLGIYLAVGTGTAGILLLGAALSWRGRRPLPYHASHAVLALCLLLAVAEPLTYTRLTGGLERTGELMIVLVVASFVLVDERWLFPTTGALIGSWGAVALSGDPEQRIFQFVALGVACALTVVVGRARSAVVAQLTEVHRAAALAVLDPLTGLVDHRGLQLLGDKLVAIARRESGAVGATFVEVPGLERVRRTAGDRAAADLLIHLAGVLESVTRRTDVVARCGENQFVLVTHGQGAPMDVLEGRIARVIEAGCPVPPSTWERRLQFGRAVLQPWDEGGLASLLAEAERDVLVRTGRRPRELSGQAMVEAQAAREREEGAAREQAASEIVAAAHTAMTQAREEVPAHPSSRPADAPDLP